ncbi:MULTISPECIES: hypothetical protein [unclassified Cyanobium]|uniref:hypothetical protein n=1 Tax=unclassified Cyanobium TaxID=2627006 RepID=UPI0020CD42C3|nr:MULTISPECIES: hypothetical protein [unclassified Cyanobium]MCP9858749.1 hypothetical protein [Cyanobium sp. Cruz-8H5]MCP9865868.1 hypothetical protein [Cyanobium sp. Cruz-8D1]
MGPLTTRSATRVVARSVGTVSAAGILSLLAAFPALAVDDPFFTLHFESTSASSTNGGINGILGEATYTFLSGTPGKMVLSLNNLSTTSSKLVSTGFNLPTNPPTVSDISYVSDSFVASDPKWNIVTNGMLDNTTFDICASINPPSDCDASGSPADGLANGDSTTVGTFTFSSTNDPLTTATQYRDAFVALFNDTGAPDGTPSAGQFPGNFFMRWKDIPIGEGSDKVWATSIRTGGGVPQTPGDEVPGPLPLLGAAAAFGYSRKLRRRMKVQSVIG